MSLVTRAARVGGSRRDSANVRGMVGEPRESSPGLSTSTPYRVGVTVAPDWCPFTIAQSLYWSAALSLRNAGPGRRGSSATAQAREFDSPSAITAPFFSTRHPPSLFWVTL